MAPAAMIVITSDATPENLFVGEGLDAMSPDALSVPVLFLGPHVQPARRSLPGSQRYVMCGLSRIADGDALWDCGGHAWSEGYAWLTDGYVFFRNPWWYAVDRDTDRDALWVYSALEEGWRPMPDDTLKTLRSRLRHRMNAALVGVPSRRVPY